MAQAWKDDVAAVMGPELGVPVVFGLLTVYGFLDRDTGRIHDPDTGTFVELTPSLLLKADAFPTMPVKGSALKADGIAFTVRDVTLVDDGTMVRLGLAGA